MGWLIALGAVLLFALVLMLRIGVRVKLCDDTLLWLGVGIFRIRLYPKREKKLRLSDYEINKFRKRKAKEESKAKKKAAKKAEKEAEKKKGFTGKVSESAKAHDKEKQGISELLDTVLEVVKVFFERFGRHLYIKVQRLCIIVASGDAATTAVLYGAVCGAVQCLLELLDSSVKLKLPKSEEMVVTTDFTAEKTRADVDITFSFRVWQIFDMAIRSLWAYIKQK